MKLSNKVLIGFFGFIFLYMTAAFTEIRFRGTLNTVDSSNSISESVDIDGVTHLVVENEEQTVIIVGSDKASLELHSSSGDLLQKLEYNVSGDTLTLGKLDSEPDRTIWITVHMPKNSLKGLIVRNADVNVAKLDQDLLNVAQIQGSVNMYDGNRIGTLNLATSNGASFHLLDSNVDTLSLQLESSQIVIGLRSPAKLLKGSMKNNSYLQINGANEVQFTKDESSKLQFN